MSDTPFNPEILNTLVKRQDIGGDCTLWLLDMTQMPVLMPEDIVEILHESAVIRYSELSRKQRRTQFVIGRLLTRYAVSTLLNRPMHDFALIERRSNTPQLRALPPPGRTALLQPCLPLRLRCLRHQPVTSGWTGH